MEEQLRILTQKTQTPCWELPKEVSWPLGERPPAGFVYLGRARSSQSHFRSPAMRGFLRVTPEAVSMIFDHWAQGVRNFRTEQRLGWDRRTEAAGQETAAGRGEALGLLLTLG